MPCVWQLCGSVCFCDPLPHIIWQHLWRLCRYCVPPLTCSVLLFNYCQFLQSEMLLQCSSVRNHNIQISLNWDRMQKILSSFDLVILLMDKFTVT